MATSSSAQREPSMEEILASIRRIIEDNDAGRKQPGGVDYTPNGTRCRRSDGDRGRCVPQRVARAARRIAPAACRTARLADRDRCKRAGAARRPEKKPLTLADVQAQIAAEASVPLAPRWNPETPAAPERSAAEERVRIAIDAARAKRDEAARAAADELAAKTEPSVDERVPASAPVARTVEVEMPATASVPVINRPAVMESAATKPAILSERAERKIAASFGELSEAFAARSKKTFDEMAEEMLRPMLRDWLDNNLPVLVERLVREEIERVARGSQ